MARHQSVQALSVLAVLLFAAACLPAPAAAGVHLSTLPKALAVTASAKSGQGARLSTSISILRTPVPLFGIPTGS
jgi:hypothetical protein